MLAAPALLVQAPSVRGAILALADAMQHRGALGAALYLAVYVVAALVLAPKWLLGGLAGFAYGRVVGVAVALPAGVLAATVASLTGRMLSHTRWAREYLEHPRFKQIDAVVRHDGRRIATLLRLSPVMPQNLLDYVLGATPLRTRDFMASMFVGFFPMTCAHVYAGSLVRHASELFEQKRNVPLSDVRAWAPPALGFVVTVVMLVLVMRLARKALTDALAQVDAGETDAAGRRGGGTPP